MTSTTTEAPAVDDHADEHGHDHPSDLLYVKVALFLAVLTAFEVATYFIEDASTTLLVAVLIPMMLIKFVTVAGYFMHLKYDNPIFRRVFIFGLGLALVVFGVVLTAFDFWSTDYLRFLR